MQRTRACEGVQPAAKLNLHLRHLGVTNGGLVPIHYITGPYLILQLSDSRVLTAPVLAEKLAALIVLRL